METNGLVSAENRKKSKVTVDVYSVEPFISFDPENGKMSGIEYELLQLIADKMRISFEFRHASAVNGTRVHEN